MTASALRLATLEPAAILTELVAHNGRLGLHLSQLKAEAHLHGLPLSVVALGQPHAPLIALEPATDPLLLTRQDYDDVTSALVGALAVFHEQHPLRRGATPTDLAARIQTWIPPTTFAQLLPHVAHQGAVRISEDLVSLAQFSVALDEPTRRAIRDIAAQLDQAPFTPVTLEELRSLVRQHTPNAEEVLAYLLDANIVSRIGPDLLLLGSRTQELKETVIALLAAQAEITVGDFKSRFGLSRKYSIPLLEYLDAAGITRRKGDLRIAGPRCPNPEEAP
jgi:selenocysteine-specific elongation factor